MRRLVLVLLAAFAPQACAPTHESCPDEAAAIAYGQAFTGRLLAALRSGTLTPAQAEAVDAALADLASPSADPPGAFCQKIDQLSARLAL